VNTVIFFALVCLALGLIGAGLAMADKRNRERGSLKRVWPPEDKEEDR
jgi:hypothetical protein